MSTIQSIPVHGGYIKLANKINISIESDTISVN